MTASIRSLCINPRVIFPAFSAAHKVFNPWLTGLSAQFKLYAWPVKRDLL
jgi:hypothetical protein